MKRVTTRKFCCLAQLRYYDEETTYKTNTDGFCLFCHSHKPVDITEQNYEE